jgi:hypothetical protein
MLSMIETMKAHPVITGLCIVCTICGAVVAPWFTPDDWSLVRKLVAGAMAGLSCAMIILATRMTGAFADDIEDDGREKRE